MFVRVSRVICPEACIRNIKWQICADAADEVNSRGMPPPPLLPICTPTRIIFQFLKEAAAQWVGSLAWWKHTTMCQALVEVVGMRNRCAIAAHDCRSIAC